MKEIGSHTFWIAYTASNIMAVVFLLAALRAPRIARLLFLLLFAWAAWTNWTTALHHPTFYLDYADSAFVPWYRRFIHGWFSRHILLSVGVIATGQGLIALSMLFKGWVLKAGGAGAIIFLLAILPLGWYAAFPCTLLMAVAMYWVLRHSHQYLWNEERVAAVTLA